MVLTRKKRRRKKMSMMTKTQKSNTTVEFVSEKRVTPGTLYQS